ncbi:MAG: hypothetical protein E6I80_26215 [Chloroflexi bacterium]|nr:MAG: hypothetical protein E6I80_26215 [Chloroflexota bacterium]
MSKGYKDETVLAAHADESTPAFLSIRFERHSGTRESNLLTPWKHRLLDGRKERAQGNQGAEQKNTMICTTTIVPLVLS